MSTSTDISELYREFTDALTEVLAENAVGPARRGRLARARAAVKRHPDYSEFRISSSSRRCFQQLGSYAKGWPVTATFDAVTARAAFSPAQLGLSKRL
jgi:hypothetical protein